MKKNILAFLIFFPCICFSQNEYSIILKRQTLSNFRVINYNEEIKETTILQSINQISPIGLFKEDNFDLIQGFIQPEILLNKINKQKLDFEVYPNPFIDHFYLQFKEKIITPVEVKILSVSGVLLYKNQFNKSNKIKIQYSNFPTSILVLVVEANNKIFSEKIIKK